MHRKPAGRKLNVSEAASKRRTAESQKERIERILLDNFMNYPDAAAKLGYGVGSEAISRLFDEIRKNKVETSFIERKVNVKKRRLKEIKADKGQLYSPKTALKILDEFIAGKSYPEEVILISLLSLPTQKVLKQHTRAVDDYNKHSKQSERSGKGRFWEIELNNLERIKSMWAKLVNKKSWIDKIVGRI